MGKNKPNNSNNNNNTTTNQPSNNNISNNHGSGNDHVNVQTVVAEEAESKSVSHHHHPVKPFIGIILSICLSVFAAWVAAAAADSSPEMGKGTHISDEKTDIQSTAASSKNNNSHNNQFMEMCDWKGLFEIVRSQGGYMYPSLTLQPDPNVVGERKLVATSEIMEGAVIYSIPDSISLRPYPKQTVLGSDSARENMLSIHYNATEMQYLVSLSVRLIEEKRIGIKSSYFDYIRCLPKTCRNLICFSYDELQELQERSLSERIRTDIGKLQRVRELISWSTWNITQVPSEEEWIWAVAMVLSRSLKINGKPRLVPIVDFINHKPSAEGIPLPLKKTGMLWVQKSSGIDKGAEIVCSYRQGELVSEFDLLYNYGFVSGHSLHALISLNLEWQHPSGSKEVTENAYRRLKNIDEKKVRIGADLTSLQLTVYFGLDGVLHADTYKYFYILCQLLHTDHVPDEAYVIRLIARTVEAHLRSAADAADISHDLALLKDPHQLPPRVREAVKFRVSRKQVVRSTLSALNTRLFHIDELQHKKRIKT